MSDTQHMHVHLLRQLDYQRWANQTLFDSLARLQPEVLHGEEGLQFGSIRATVAHLLAAIRQWGALLRDEPLPSAEVQDEPAAWPDLKRQLQDELRLLRHWLEQQAPDTLHGRIAYSRPGGEIHYASRSDILTQLSTQLDHQRGQLSAVATRLGAPLPAMDYIYFVRDMDRAAHEAQQQQQ